MGAPLLDFLAVETEGPKGLKYPSRENLKTYQNNKGLTFSVLKEVEVREIICGESTHEEIEKFHEWITEMHLKNQDEFDTRVVSMDVEDVKASYFDIMRMEGEIVISNSGTQIFKKRVDERAVPGISEGCWKESRFNLVSWKYSEIYLYVQEWEYEERWLESKIFIQFYLVKLLS